MAAKGEGRQTGSAYSSFRKTLHDPLHAKTCYFYKDGDYKFSGIKVAVHPKRYRRLEALYAELSNKVRGLPYGVRSIFTPRGRDVISSVEGLQDDGHYICSTFKHKAGGMNLNHVLPPPMWNYKKPPSGQRNLNSMLQDPDLDDMPRVKRARYIREQRMANAYNRSHPKKITVLRNGDPTQRHILLINRRTAQTFDQILSDVSEMFQCAVRKLFTMEGRKVLSLTQLFNGPEVLVAAGKEPFKSMMGFQFEPHPPAQPRTTRSRLGGDFAADKLKNRRDRLMRTKGQWKVWVTTNELSSGGTTAQVTLTAYGHKGQSMPLPLGFGDDEHFKAGHIDEFDLSFGSLGELYKIRLAHDNTGDYPSWLCDEVRMHDKDTGEELVFPVKRWLSRDEDDHEICRELPVNRCGEPHLPVIKYEVSVVTGNLWNAGTDANVYLTVYGDRGDTGVRQLFSSNRDHVFNKGQTDHFTVEAVTLGKLKRVIVGHDGTNPGDGWFLEKITIQEPDAKPQDVYTFLCNRWLDEAEDDGKIVRELKVQDEYMDDILSKRNWELEKWKFENKNQVMFFSMVTGKALRLKSDGTVDGLGEDVDPGAMFIVSSKKPMVRIFTSLLNASFHLAIDNGKVVGHGRGGPYCEFRIHTQNDSTVMLEGVKSPLQFVSFQDNGKLGDPRGVLDKDPGKRFHVYCKGMLRHRGIIMLKTSNTQAISVDHDLSLFGTGKCNRAAHFRVHKVDSGNIRMFESMISPGKYLRLFDGKIDCQGGRDDKSHFLVEKHRDKGYVTIQSRGQRGVFVGMTPKGDVRPTVDTGVSNIWLYPEVVDFGVSKTMLGEDKLTPISERDTIDTQRSAKNEIMEGDWKVIVQSLENLENGQVLIVVYGDKGQSEPIALVPPVKNGPSFRAGSPDEFKINLLKVGEVYKVRLELASKSAGRSPKWKVGNVQLQDLNTKKELLFRFDRWLSRQEDDGEIMRELPVFAKGKEVLPMRQYEVRVYTGKEGSADTTAAVYINLFGEHGDCGKRMLIKSNNKTPFLKGQVDKFEVEAVSLGKLAQCLVGHDGTRSGDGWYLDSIVVRESKNSGREYVFPCNRWLDAGREDRKIERMLQVKVVPEVVETGPTPKPEAGEYQMLVKTASDSSAANGGKVSIIAFGSQGQSKVTELSAPSQKGQPFEPGNIDEFDVAFGNIGEIQKLRVIREDKSTWKAWHLEEIKMTDKATNNTMVFAFDRWFSRDMDDHDLVRELPALKDNKPISKVCQYEVTTFTGDHWAAGTDATAHITLFGTNGDSGKRILYAPNGGADNFRVDMEDNFQVEAVDLGDLTSVVIGHNGKGHGAGWFLDKVVVKVKGGDGGKCSFPCMRWLDDGEDDGKTERELRRIEMPDLLQIAPMSQKNNSTGEWKVYVRTSDIEGAATCAQVYLTVYGSKGVSPPLPLGDGSSSSDNFWRGKEVKFQVNAGRIGEIRKIRLEHDNRNPDPAWHVESVRMVDMATEEELFFPINRWLAEDKDDGQLHREFPVMSPGVAPVPVLRYIIAVQTGKQPSAGASDGWISVNLIGRNGDTGQQLLQRPLSSPSDKMTAGKLDVYMLEAVSVGTLQGLRLVFEGKGKAQKWFVEHVLVLESVCALEEAIFNFSCWLDASGENTKEVPLSDTQISYTITEDVAKQLLGHYLPESEGRWEVTVWTSKESDAGTKDPVMLVLYGSTGHTEPKPLNKDFTLNPDSVVKLQVETGQIGPLFKIRLLFGDRSGNSSWSMDRLKLKDLDTGEEFHFDDPIKVESSPSSPDGATELPAIRPDIAPLPDITYLVKVSTGSQDRADTDAEIFCTLIGQWGDSGERVLREPKSHKDPFKKGQTDEFEVKTLQLGHVRKLMIGHNESGRGHGWFCQQVTVQALNAPPPDRKPEVVFLCNRWMDSGCEDRRLVRELIPSGEILPPDLAVDKSLSRGKWRCTVKMATEDELDPSLTAIQLPEQVSLTAYGTRGTAGPLKLQDPNRDLFLLGQTDKFENVVLGGIGNVQKLRMSAGQEDDDNPVWMIEQVTLEDVDSHEVLHFDFRRWVGEVGGDIHRELPVLVAGQLPPAVLEYEVQVETENAKDAGTNASVFINIYGKNGDSGRRRLVTPRSRVPQFQQGQTDIFLVEAVDVGKLQKVVVTKGPGHPWQLNQVKVKAGRFSAVSHIFIWSNTIGSPSEQTEEVSITIPVISTTPAPVAIPIKQANYLPTSGGQWSVETVTGEKGVSGEGTDLVLVLCGDKGESSPVNFLPVQDTPFKPRQTDAGVVHLAQDIGELIKVRMGFADNSKNKSLDIVKIKFEDVDTRDYFHHELSRPLAVDEKSDGWTEFPVVWPAVFVLPVIVYKIEVTTGSVPKGTTDADVFIQLYGRMGSTGRRLLKKSNNEVKFQLGQTDVFELEAVSLMSLDKVLIGHNDATAGKGWFVKKLVVHPHGDEEYVFECNRWFDGGEDDGRIERMLTLNEDAAPTPDVGPAQKAGNKWVVWATTGSGSNQGTSSPVVVVLYGDKGHTEPMLLGDSPDPPVKFTEGQTQQFEVASDVDVGKVYKVRVGFLGDGREPLWYSNFSHSPSWYLERLKIQEESSGRQYVFEAKRWIRVDQQHDHWKEFPVYTRNEQDMLPVKEYYVEVYTGDANFAGTDANVYLEIFGDRGDTGKRHLHGTKAPGNMFEKKKHDMFIVEAVDLGSLRKVKVSHDGYGAGSGWFLDKITIKESQSSKEKYVFECHKWLDVDEGDGAIERELPLAGLMGDHVDAATDVDWQVRVMTSMCESFSGTDSKVTLTVFGERGTSGPQPLRPEDGIFHPGQTDNFEITLNPGEIGRIQKIRLEHDNTGKQPDWHVEKVIMNNNLGEEVKFTVDRWLSYNMMNGNFPSDIVCEAPAKWPDQQPLSRYNYIVKTVTPPDPGAGTDATIYINVVGSRGDSGVRELRRNLEQPQPKFQEGLTDSFVLEAVDLGTLEKVIVGLKNPSSGTSWKPQCVLVRVSETESSLEKENYVFPWGKHLDARHPEAEIMLAEVVDDYVEREITGLTPRGSAPHTYRSPREGGITLEHGESSPQASPRTSQTLAPDINRSPRAGGLRMQQGPHGDESGSELEIGEFSARSDY
ncbi:lipoxygenase homology domain-containing protein 1-like isoform X2 [Littorina saxatilis]|uniref:lipoxygenase homology domain-containing protein 1-like isoform X2 n=1 Tax=Littorina saxatilis TaxID=31220 RepID=UPI0038B43552